MKENPPKTLKTFLGLGRGFHYPPRTLLLVWFLAQQPRAGFKAHLRSFKILVFSGPVAISLEFYCFKAYYNDDVLKFTNLAWLVFSTTDKPERWTERKLPNADSLRVFFCLKNPNLLRIDVICSGFFKFRIKLLKSIIILLFCGSGLWIPTVFFFLYKTDLDQSDKKTEIFFLTDESECRTHMEYWHSFEILSNWWKFFYVPVFLHLYEQTIKNIPRTVGNSGICIHRAQRRNLGISMMQNNSGLFITIAIWWWVIFTAPMSPAASQMF